MNSLFRTHITIPGTKRAERAYDELSVGERTVFFLFALIMIGTGLMILFRASDSVSVTIPSRGGEIIEGTLGSPRFINPLLAISDADRDLTYLLFSGLLRATTEGEIVPELASEYQISPDGLTYNVTIKDGAVFHDGQPITADDVIFTVTKAKDPTIKSPKRAEWEGVTVEKISDKSIAFHLPRPYYPFIENLTLGIIPRHHWKDVNSDEFAFSLKNISPIGSGPYKISKIIKDDQGIPTSYELKSFSKYVNGQPFINSIIIKIFGSESEMIDSWLSGKITSMGGISPADTKGLATKNAKILQLNLPRVFGIFFNQNHAPIFLDKNVRQALDVAVDKQLLVETVLQGYGSTLEGPLPKELIVGNTTDIQMIGSTASTTIATSSPITSTTTPTRVENALKILAKSGWKYNEETKNLEKTDKKSKTTQTLSFALYAPNVPELKEVANFAIAEWKKIGVNVELKLFEISDLSQNIIRPRKYDALLFGEVIGRNPDLFAFWHSSQRNDPGYNIALYTNSKVDAMLDSARSAKGGEKQTEIMKNIFDEINKDMPAIFLYSPNYLYIVAEEIKGFKEGSIASPSERFSGVKDWYVANERVWEIFADKTLTN